MTRKTFDRDLKRVRVLMVRYSTTSILLLPRSSNTGRRHPVRHLFNAPVTLSFIRHLILCVWLYCAPSYRTLDALALTHAHTHAHAVHNRHKNLIILMKLFCGNRFSFSFGRHIAMAHRFSAAPANPGQVSVCMLM